MIMSIASLSIHTEAELDDLNRIVSRVELVKYDPKLSLHNKRTNLLHLQYMAKHRLQPAGVFDLSSIL